MKYLYLPEMPLTIRRISNSCKVVEYSHVVECGYELHHIPSKWYIVFVYFFVDTCWLRVGPVHFLAEWHGL